MIRYSAEVIVIGAGIAGVTAAIELLDRGRRVLLLDRDTEENMGGLAKESFGGIWFAGTPLQKRYGIRDGAHSVLEGAPLKPGIAGLAQLSGAPVVPCVLIGRIKLAVLVGVHHGEHHAGMRLRLGTGDNAIAVGKEE